MTLAHGAPPRKARKRHAIIPATALDTHAEHPSRGRRSRAPCTEYDETVGVRTQTRRARDA